MTLSRKNGPLYLQVKKIIKDRILHGIYPLGSHIPAEPQLEQEFQVSKMTVRNAVRELAEDGYVERKSGVGTIVLRNTANSVLSKGKRFTELLVESGQRLEKKQISEGLVELEQDSEAFVSLGPTCLRIERLYTLNNQPYIHFIHCLPAHIADQERPFPEQFSLYEWLEEREIAPVTFRDRFLVDFATAQTADLLGVAEGAALLKRVRCAYDGAGKMVEYGCGYYRTDVSPYLVHYDV